MKHRTSLSYFIYILLLSQIIACSTERIDNVDKLNFYVDLRPYLESKSQPSQFFEVVEYNSAPIMGEQGTKINLNVGQLILPNGDLIDYPFKIELIELYSAKDMIYKVMPTVSYKNAMETRGEIFIRAYQEGLGGKEVGLELNSGATFKLEIPTDSVSDNLKVYYGIPSAADYNWTDNGSTVGANDGDLYFTAKDTTIEARVGKLGWINAGYAQNGLYSITFNSEQDDLNHVEIFAYLPKYRSVLRAFNRQITGIPRFTSTKIIAMAMDSEGQLYTDTSTVTPDKSMSRTITLKPISDEGLTAILESLQSFKSSVVTPTEIEN